jgi:hypothetical protein
MTSRERVLTAVRHRQPDRAPFDSSRDSHRISYRGSGRRRIRMTFILDPEVPFGNILAFVEAVESAI